MLDAPTPNVMAAAEEIARCTVIACDVCKECKYDEGPIDWNHEKTVRRFAAIITRNNANAEREVERYKQYYRRDVCIVGELLTEIEPLLGLKPTIGDSILQRVPALGIAIKKLIAEVQLHRKSMG